MDEIYESVQGKVTPKNSTTKPKIQESEPSLDEM
jgi:hypothetical protein